MRVKAGRHRSLSKPLGPAPVPQPVCLDACDRRARRNEKLLAELGSIR
jgi:hypothetical protein